MVNPLPSGPTTSKVWQLLNWIADPFNYMEQCTQHYGDMFTMHLSGLNPLVFISNPQGIQEIFNGDAQHFDAGKGNDILRPLLGDHSLALLDGDRHKRQRKLLMPPFHGERMFTYGETIARITQQVTQTWETGQTIVARTAMQDITLEVILQVVFGLREGDRYQQIKPLLADMLDMTNSPLRSSLLFFKFLQTSASWSPWGKMMQRKAKIYQLLQEEIHHRKTQNLHGEDILSLMLSARDEVGEPMTEQELCDQMMILLVGGHETTATSLAWAFYWIYRLPKVQDKLLQELDSLGSNPDPMAIFRLPYLNAICQETQRIYPVVPITFIRVAKVPVTIMGHQFDAGTSFAPCIYLTHQRKDLYPDPKQFRPERFLERQFSPYEYIPFGGGNRRCLGAALAMFEMKLVLAQIVSQYQLALTNDHPVLPKRRGVTLAPENGIPLRILGKREQVKPLVSLQ